MEKNMQYHTIVTFKQLEQNLIEQITLSVLNNGSNDKGYLESDGSYTDSDTDVNDMTDQFQRQQFNR